jgi:hypothetical protein
LVSFSCEWPARPAGQEVFFASFMAAAVQRKAIEDELQRFTLRVTRRTVLIIFSMMLEQASEGLKRSASSALTADKAEGYATRSPHREPRHMAYWPRSLVQTPVGEGTWQE